MEKSRTRLLIIIVSLFLTGCTLGGVGYNDYYNPARASKLVSTARSMIGKPYCWGGTSPEKGFDCSGYVWWVYHKNGYSLPRTAAEQADVGYPVARANLRAGDIVVFRQSWSKHTGIYSGKNTFLHSPKSGSHIREEGIDSKHWTSCFIEGRRIAE